MKIVTAITNVKFDQNDNLQIESKRVFLFTIRK